MEQFIERGTFTFFKRHCRFAVRYVPRLVYLLTPHGVLAVVADPVLLRRRPSAEQDGRPCFVYGRPHFVDGRPAMRGRPRAEKRAVVLRSRPSARGNIRGRLRQTRPRILHRPSADSREPADGLPKAAGGLPKSADGSPESADGLSESVDGLSESVDGF